MYTGNECIDCIGFFATFPLIHPDQVYPNSTNIRSIGTVVKDQVIKWDTLKGTETLFTSRTCHETHNYVVCTCNTLQPFSPNDSKLISVESLHGHSNAIQVSHTQWCVISEMNSFTYGGLTCPADHSFCYGPDRHPRMDAKGRRGLPMVGRHLLWTRNTSLDRHDGPGTERHPPNRVPPYNDWSDTAGKPVSGPNSAKGRKL